MDTDSDHVAAMAEAARWAPSVHNTQPWALRSRPDGLLVMVDERRGLPALDPTGRLRTISCGAAVANASLASLVRGFGTRVQLLPDGPHASPVARLVVVGPRTPSDRERRLAGQTTTRRSHRVVHPGETVPDLLLADLVDTVADEGARLTVLTAPARRTLARLLLRAAREQQHRPDLLLEARAWVREPGRGMGRVAPVDGVLRGSLTTVPPGLGAPTLSREHGPVAQPMLAQIVDSSVVVLSTLTDTRRDHLIAGIALQRMLLHLSALGLVAAFADQATEVPDTRSQLAALLARPGHAQVVLRVGRALVDVRVPPRRPLHDVLDADGPPTVIDLTHTHERTRS